MSLVIWILSVCLVCGLTVCYYWWIFNRPRRSVDLGLQVVSCVWRPIHLLDRLRSSATQDPRRLNILRTDPLIVCIPWFLSPDECNQIVNQYSSRLKTSTVNGTTDAHEKQSVRTSSSALLSNKNRLVCEIKQKAASFMQLPVDRIESLQMVRYLPGQYYHAHYDYFNIQLPSTKQALRHGGQRIATFFVYLNDLPNTESGGGTHFPHLQLTVKPQKGMAVWFSNIDSKGWLDSRVLHAGLPPTCSIKYGLNIWVRELPFSD